VTISYRLPAKLVKYQTLLDNACLAGDVAFLLESWGDLALLRRSAPNGDLSATPPHDNLKRPINMDFDKDTLTMGTSGVDFTSSTYEESRHAVVRDHGEWAVLHQWTIGVQFISAPYQPTVRRHEYPSYKKELDATVVHQTYAPQDTSLNVDAAI